MQGTEKIFTRYENKSLEEKIIPFTSANIKRVNDIFNIHSIFIQDLVFFNHNHFEIRIYIESFDSISKNTLTELNSDQIEKIYIQFLSVFEVSKIFGYDFIDFKNFTIELDSGIKFPIILETANKTTLQDILGFFRETRRFQDLSDKNYFEIFEQLKKKHHYLEEKFYFYRKGDMASNILVSYPYNDPINDLNFKVNIKTENQIQKSIIKSILRQHLFSDKILFFNIDSHHNPIQIDILNQIFKGVIPRIDDFIDIINELKIYLDKSSFQSIILILDRVKTREEKEFVRYLLDSSEISNLILITFDDCEPVDFDLVLKEKPENLFNRFISFNQETQPLPLNQEEILTLKVLKTIEVPVSKSDLDYLFGKEELDIIHGLVKKKYLLSKSGKISINSGQVPNEIHMSMEEEKDIIQSLLPKVNSVNLRICFLVKSGELNQLGNIFLEILAGAWENYDLEMLKQLLIDHYSTLAKDLKLMELLTTILIRENEFGLSKKIISDLGSRNEIFFNLKQASIFNLEKDYQSMFQKLKKIDHRVNEKYKDEYHFLRFIYYEKVSDFTNADRFFQKIKDEFYINQAHIQMSDRYIYSGDHEKAEQILKEAAGFFHKIYSFRNELMALNQLAKLLREKRNFKDSEKLYKNIFIKSEIRNYHLISGFIAVDIGNLYWIQDAFDQAEFWYKKALVVFRLKNNQNGKILVESNMVEVNKIKGNWMEAESYLKTTLKYDQDKKLLISKAIDLYNISHLEYLRRNFNPALEIVEQAITLFKKKNNLNGVVECLFLKYKILFFLNSPDSQLNCLDDYLEVLNSDQKKVLWLLNNIGKKPTRNAIHNFEEKINEIESRTQRFEITLLLIHRFGFRDFSNTLLLLSIELSQKSKNYFYYEYFWIYFMYKNSKNMISKDEKNTFTEMYYFFLKNKRKIPSAIQSLKKSLDERDSVYDVFKSAELVSDYLQWKIPEDFFKSFSKELFRRIKLNLIKLWIFEQDSLLFHFSNRNEFDELSEEMVNRAISLAEHLSMSKADIKKYFQSGEKLFYPYNHSKVILWKISPRLSAVVLLAFLNEDYLNINLYENYRDFFKHFALLIQKYYENDFQLNKKLDFIIGDSKPIKNLKQQILKVSKVDFSLLITGESGSGKELVAKAVHILSKRSNKPFVSVNSAAIPEHLLEAELFGFKAGAFTGATDNRIGLIESADSGTLFLDEIADLPLHLQAKLLRVLQDNEIRRLGENKVRNVDVRLISATNRDLGGLIKLDRFREDLFFRIQDLTIHVPNLGEREDDIALLTQYFLNKYGFVIKDELEFQGIVEGFKQKTWKGNVRELESQIKRLITFYPGHETIERTRQEIESGLKAARANFEKSLILKTLSENGWNKVKSAKKLKISRGYLFDLIKKYKIRKTQI